MLVGEIAQEGNRILAAPGERLRYSTEKVGHRLWRPFEPVLGCSSRASLGAGPGSSATPFRRLSHVPHSPIVH